MVFNILDYNKKLVLDSLKSFKEVNLSLEDLNLPKDVLLLKKNFFKIAKLINRLFLEQNYLGNIELFSLIKKEEKKLKELNSRKNKDLELLKKFFIINLGPFDRLNNDKSIYSNITKPLGAGFYAGINDKFLLKDFFSEKSLFEERSIIKKELLKNKVILSLTPYNIAYNKYLKELNKELIIISNLIKKVYPNTSIFLRERAKSFLTNNYFKSERLWVLNNDDLEITIGPYEVYEDNLFGVKSSFELIISYKDPLTKDLEKINNFLPKLIKNISLLKKFHEKRALGLISINNLLLSAGDARAGVHVTAYNLPNDELIRKKVGSKKILLKNVAENKFNHSTKLITKKLFKKEADFEAYFYHVLLHEISHSLGPAFVNKKPINIFLKELYSLIEEAKADSLAILLAFKLADINFISKEFSFKIAEAAIKGIFRSLRFGLSSAHAKANLLLFNYLLKKKVLIHKNNILLINRNNLKDVIFDYVKELLIIESKGDYKRASSFINAYCCKNNNIINKELINSLLKKISDVPIDIVFDFYYATI